MASATEDGQMPTLIFRYLPSLQNMSVAGPMRTDLINTILAITQQLGESRTNDMKHLAISLQLKLLEPLLH